jgi:hypothetical protein
MVYGLASSMSVLLLLCKLLTSVFYITAYLLQSQRGQTVPRSDRPSGPQGPPRLCQPGHPLELPVGSPEAGGGEPLASVKKNESSPLEAIIAARLECLRDPPGTGFSMIWCLLRTVGVVLLYLSVAGKAWRCGGAVLTELLSFKASECCTFSCSSKWCNRCKARFLQVP